MPVREQNRALIAIRSPDGVTTYINDYAIAEKIAFRLVDRPKIDLSSTRSMSSFIDSSPPSVASSSDDAPCPTAWKTFPKPCRSMPLRSDIPTQPNDCLKCDVQTDLIVPPSIPIEFPTEGEDLTCERLRIIELQLSTAIHACEDKVQALLSEMLSYTSAAPKKKVNFESFPTDPTLCDTTKICAEPLRILSGFIDVLGFQDDWLSQECSRFGPRG